jgi:hypothetical protein
VPASHIRRNGTPRFQATGEEHIKLLRLIYLPGPQKLGPATVFSATGLTLERKPPMSGHAVHIKIDGRTYSGTYSLDRGQLTVKTTFGTKTAVVPPKVKQEELAHQLLTVLVTEEKGRKNSRL